MCLNAMIKCFKTYIYKNQIVKTTRLNDAQMIETKTKISIMIQITIV